MGSDVQEKNTSIAAVDLETGSNSSGNATKKSSDNADPPAYDTRTTASVVREDGEEINYNTLSWWRAAVILVAETVSLGILSLPSVLASVGLVPGVVLIIFIAVLSGYSGLVFGEFCRRYPYVQSYGDAGEVMAQPYGPTAVRFAKELLGWGQTIFQVFVMGSHLLTWTIALNTLSDSSQCRVMWAGVGLLVFWVWNLPRTLKYTSYMSIVSSLSIFSAVIVTIVDVAIERPIGSTSIDVANKLGFASAFLSVTNIAIAFCAHSCFFSVMSELKVKEDWPKALAMLQVLDTSLYLVAAVVIYVYVGPDVPSPALSAAGSVVMRKVIWGIALPTIVIAGVIYAHVAAKFIFLRLFANTRHIAKRTAVGRIGWLSITMGIWIVAFVIAESIPVFNSLLSLVCALFASWFSYGIPGLMWLFLYKEEYFKDWKMMIGLASNIFLVIAGFLLCVLGIWSTVASLDGDSATKPWTCGSNA